MKWASLALCTPALLFCQEFRGTIGGVVTDPAKQPIDGARITATELRTGTKAQTVSNASGQYTIPFLGPGEYQITADATGFKQFVRKGIQLGSGDHLTVDLELQLGEISQSVEVSAAPPLVNSDNASIGQIITTKEVEDLPLDGRTPMMLAQLSIGVVARRIRRWSIRSTMPARRPGASAARRRRPANCCSMDRRTRLGISASPTALRRTRCNR